MESKRKENPLLKEIKEKYTYLELTTDTTSTPEDIGIITIGTKSGGEYIGAIRETDEGLFYCPRRIGGQRNALPLTNMDDLAAFSQILYEEYGKFGITLPMAMDLSDYGCTVRDGLKAFTLSYGAISRMSKEFYGCEETVLWNLFKFSFVYIKSEKIVEIHIYRTDDNDFETSVKVDNILDGVRWIAQQLDEHVKQLKENVDHLRKTIDNLNY